MPPLRITAPLASLTWRALRERLCAPVPALAVDLFRVLVGLVSLGYCARLLIDVPVFWAPRGLVDHAASRAAFWFTAQPLFWPGMSAAAITAILSCACALALAVALGLRPRLCAAALYLIVVCGYRFNFLVLYVDDMVVHLLLFWVVLMPVGRTLTIGGWRERAAWRTLQVPGAAVHLFLGNLAVLYTIAGLTKLGSPLWRAGDGVYAALKIPAGWFADSLGPAHVPFLRFINFATLVLEPLFALLLCLPGALGRRGRALRAALALCFALFHLGITLTLDVPFANLGCLGALPLLLRDEVRRRWGRPALAEPGELRLAPRERFACLALCLITGAALSAAAQAEWRRPLREGAPPPRERLLSAEAGGPVQSGLFSALWLLGLAQQYRLLDWIDQRNYHVTLRIHERRAAGVRVLPRSALLPAGMRASLLMTYLAGVTWMPVSARALPALRVALQQRLAQRHCWLQRQHGPADVRIQITLTRVNPSAPQPAEELTLVRFRCASDGAALLVPTTTP